MKRSIKLLIVTGILSVAASVSSLAGWVQDSNGWKLANSNGGYFTDASGWIDSNNDGVAEFYVIGEDGYMMHDTTATLTGAVPINIQLGSDGTWTVNGVTITDQYGVNGNYSSDYESLEVLTTAGLGTGSDYMIIHQNNSFQYATPVANGVWSGTYSNVYSADAWTQNLPATYTFDGNGGLTVSYNEPGFLTGTPTAKTETFTKINPTVN